MLDLIAKHGRNGILVDTNILLLEVVGSAEPKILANRSFRRTERFTVHDFRTLESLLRRFARVVTTPNILTEVSNLCGQLAEPARSRILRAFGNAIGAMRERQVSGTRLAAEEMFVRFGITDCGIMLAARKGYLVLTDDFPLANYLLSNGLDAINFNHLRKI